MKRTLGLAASLLGLAPTLSMAQVTPSPVSGWDEFVERLRMLPERLLAKLPREQRSDPQIQQEVARVVLASLAANTLEAIGADGDHPTFLANQNAVLNYPQPNADTIYRVAQITPGGRYRLSGTRGSLRLVSIGQAGPLPIAGNVVKSAPAPRRSFLDLNTLSADAEGRFELIVSPARPAGYTGNWWQLEPATSQLLLRMVASDWGTERDPAIAIERLDVAVNKARTAASELERRLRSLAPATAFLPMRFVDHVSRLRAEGTINKLKRLDLAQGGLEGQTYYEGAFELRDGEALLVEAPAPPGCTYRSLLLANELEETIDWVNNQSSLNDADAKPDSDGVLRFVIAAKDPGVPNWLDTAGHKRGLISGRWTGCASNPLPSVRLIPLSNVRVSLPKDTPVVTPAAREAIIRAKRAAYQRRPLW